MQETELNNFTIEEYTSRRIGLSLEFYMEETKLVVTEKMSLKLEINQCCKHFIEFTHHQVSDTKKNIDKLSVEYFIISKRF